MRNRLHSPEILEAIRGVRLAAVTRVAAEMLDLADVIGTVEVGKRADMVILREDPLEDLRAFRTVLWTVRAGEIRAPEGWMEP